MQLPTSLPTTPAMSRESPSPWTRDSCSSDPDGTGSAVMGVETWTLIPCVPKVAARDAARAEAEGWTGVLLADSQNLAAELVVEMSACLMATERVRVSPGVTNPVTRHPAVLAGAMATLNVEYGGRASVEIGRGDSALAHLGFAPMKVAPFKRYVQALQGFLGGGEVPFNPEFAPGNLAGIATLRLGEEPAASSLRWLRPDAPKVPVAVTATGPKVIALAAEVADAVTLSVGADLERIRPAVDIARAAVTAAGRNADQLPLGAFVNVAVHDDIRTAAAITSGKLASFSRFSAMHGRAVSVSNSADAAEIERIRGAYNMNSHGSAQSEQAQEIPIEFAQRNAVIGSPDACLKRLWELREAGITRFMFAEDFSRVGDSGLAHKRLVEEVIPEVNSWV
ncbi:LLM class flavin-dependent oxidoreductase [Gordonia sp. DT30]|uniref:LLM class flavin-dependent oxidoreductase n=1 Tax=Gordonia sp. DT30 TaxID=3416546 RepID=UPI003CF9DF6A